MFTSAYFTFIAFGYAISSSLLVIVNKYVLINWPYSTTLTFLQFTAAWIFAYFAGAFAIFEVDRIEWKKIKAFSPACLTFFVAIVCNMKLLEHANVDTFIMLRSTIPLATVSIEYCFLGLPFPRSETIVTLVMIIIGAVGYVLSEQGIEINAYSWGLAYVVSMVVDTLLVKKVVSDVDLKPWGLVLYNNLIASTMYPFFALGTGELFSVKEAIPKLYDSSSVSRFPVLMSCVFGIAISFFGLNARKALSPTSFSVLGVVCKFGTVLLNTTVWEHHASPFGVLCLCICIISGVLYQKTIKVVPKPEKLKDPELAQLAKEKLQYFKGPQSKAVGSITIMPESKKNEH